METYVQGEYRHIFNQKNISIDNHDNYLVEISKTLENEVKFQMS